MKMISSEEMKKLEDSCGVSKLQLMENAGRGIYNVIKEKFPALKDKKILVVAYHGNNGGDGFVAARYLCEEAETDVLFMGDDERLKDEGRINYTKIENNNKIQLFQQAEAIDFGEYDVIIDAMLGTGAGGEIKLKEPMASVIKDINDSSAFKVAVDIPTGINPNTGEESERWVNPDLIITFHDMKRGIGKFKDKTVVVDIGI